MASATDRPSLPSLLHYTAAGLYLATIPKHTLVGLNKVDPATATIDDSYTPIKQLLTPTWFYINGSLAISAILSIRWARVGGALSNEGLSIIAIQAIVGAAVVWKYFTNKMYVGLGCLWAAPAATVAAAFLSS